MDRVIDLPTPLSLVGTQTLFSGNNVQIALYIHFRSFALCLSIYFTLIFAPIVFSQEKYFFLMLLPIGGRRKGADD